MKIHADANEHSQAVCWTTQAGHLWMRDYYDRLPSAIRRRLRESPHNICPACLVIYFLPVVQKKHPRLPYEKQLLIAIVIMEKLAEEAYQKRPPALPRMVALEFGAAEPFTSAPLKKLAKRQAKKKAARVAKGG